MRKIFFETITLKTIFLFVAIVFLNAAVLYSAEVKTERRDDGSWRLLVDGAPYFIRGVNESRRVVFENPNEAAAG